MDRRQFIKGSIGAGVLAALGIGKPIEAKPCGCTDSGPTYYKFVDFKIAPILKPQHTITQKGNWELDLWQETIDVTGKANSGKLLFEQKWKVYEHGPQYWTATIEQKLPREWVGDIVKLKLISEDYDCEVVGEFICYTPTYHGTGCIREDGTDGEWHYIAEFQGETIGTIVVKKKFPYGHGNETI